MSLEEKAAQMVMIRVFGQYQNPRSDGYRRLAQDVRARKVGGVVLFASELETVPRLLNDLQALTEVPLLVAADLERGLAFRIPSGSVPLPSAMAVGATRSPEAALFMGEVTAREGRALGIHWAFAPVADVNNNPHNPVINLRSFGEDPALVASMTSAFIRGARGGGMLTTAKHFPGHGNTAVDSHVGRPVVEADRGSLDRVELVPFRAAIGAGVDAIMLGHISVPALDPSGAPATLSAAVTTGLLREEMGFEGLVVTDALEMAGIRPAWTGEATVRAVQAGADVILLPSNTAVAIQSMVRAVQEGQLREDRLDTSVRRILEAKARLGLHKKRQVDESNLGASVARPADIEKAMALARDSITLVRNREDVLPLHAEAPLRLLHLLMSGQYRDLPSRSTLLQRELRARRIETETQLVGPDVSQETTDRILTDVSRFTHVLISAFVRVPSSSAVGDLTDPQVGLLEEIHARGVPMIVTSFGSPYLLADLPEVAAFVCAYGAAESSQKAAMAALFGEADIRGKLPVTLPGLHPFGHGLDLGRRAMTLRVEPPEAVGLQVGGMAEVDRVVQHFVEEGAFPGGVLAVGHKGALVHLKAFGRLSYDADATPVTTDTMYDLASLTKVVVTTTIAMILVDEGALDLDKPAQEFLPLFLGPGKHEVTVRQLLTHSSGIDRGGDLYKELRGEAAYLERIQAMGLVYEPDTKSLYSDFGPILLGEILERVAGQPLEEFARERIFAPLGMADTRYRPGSDDLERIAPTEFDPWRGRMIRGEVHDENAFAMGGVAPHAGLFSTAADLARYAQMILNGGVLEHQRIVSRATVETFTRRAGLPESTRALGWDTKSAEGSSAGSFFSPRSFGHLGFTGTSMWIDPDRELFVILLTNRVHPTRDNILIRKARPAIADAVVQALADP